jgi:hypothetical protein
MCGAAADDSYSVDCGLHDEVDAGGGEGASGLGRVLASALARRVPVDHDKTKTGGGFYDSLVLVLPPQGAQGKAGCLPGDLAGAAYMEFGALRASALGQQREWLHFQWEHLLSISMLTFANNQWIMNLILPIVSIVTILALWFTRKCDLAILLAWCAGFILGFIWEIAFLFAGEGFTTIEGCHSYNGGPEFCLYTPAWIPTWWNNVGHALEDAGIFMIGVGLAWLILGRNKRPRFMRWHWGEFAIIWFWGIGSEMVVTWVQTGKMFYFFPQTWNPAYYETAFFQDLFYDKPDLIMAYTIIPDGIWWFATIPFYAILIWLKRRYGGKYFKLEKPADEIQSEASGQGA